MDSALACVQDRTQSLRCGGLGNGAFSHRRPLDRATDAVGRGRWIYELDDAVFLLFPDKVPRLCSMADHVIVANQNLAEWVRPHNTQVSIIPTCVDAIDIRRVPRLPRIHRIGRSSDG